VESSGNRRASLDAVALLREDAGPDFWPVGEACVAGAGWDEGCGFASWASTLPTSVNAARARSVGITVRMLINLFSNFPHKPDASRFRRVKACYFALAADFSRKP
jgi:hypothetical protein